jgi:tRNA nucleotidyltransferase (CCA-adding enzyme)
MLWDVIIDQSEEAQDDGAFSDEAGVKGWLAANETAILKDAERRLQKATAAYEKKQADHLIATKARAAVQKAAARALKAAKREAESAGLS